VSVAPANGPGAAAPYRISVGAFSHADYAKRQEQVFKKAGYPAFLAPQGDLTIVLVGPYRTQTQADAVAAKIKGGGFGVDPVVYEFKGTQDHAPQPASASSGGTSTGSAAPSTASTSTASTSSSSSSSSGAQHYLQVGAYNTAASAKPQRDKMASMGYQVTERTEGGLVKVLIGPFGPAKLTQVESQLKAAGIASFPR
jgi:cell division septation protein DedD